jgi:hypothetical protein
VVAFKAYLRTNTGNHKVVSARTAARYFGPVPPGEKSPRCASLAACVLRHACSGWHRLMSLLQLVRPSLLLSCV